MEKLEACVLVGTRKLTLRPAFKTRDGNPATPSQVDWHMEGVGVLTPAVDGLSAEVELDGVTAGTALVMVTADGVEQSITLNVVPPVDTTVAAIYIDVHPA